MALPSRFGGAPGRVARTGSVTCEHSAACPRGARRLYWRSMQHGADPALADRVPARPRRRFRPRLWPTLATALGLAVLIGLGTWQVERLEWKRALIAEREAQLAAPPAAAAGERRGLAGLGFPPGRRARQLPPRPRAAVRRRRDRRPRRPSRADASGPAGRRRRPGRSRLGSGGPGASGGAPPGPARRPGRGQLASPATAATTGPAGSRRTTSRRSASGTATTCRRSSARSASSCCRW